MFTFTSDTVQGSKGKQTTQQNLNQVFDRIKGNPHYNGIFNHQESLVKQMLTELDYQSYKDIPALVKKLKDKLLAFSKVRAFTTAVEEKLKSAIPISLADLAKYLGNDASGRNAFYEKLARKVKELCETPKKVDPATTAMIFQARTAVTSGKHALQESNVIAWKPPNQLLTNIYLKILTKKLIAIARHKDGPAVIQQVALMKQQPGLQAYFVEIEKVLIELDGHWQKLKPNAQDECCKAVLAIHEFGKARGAFGELSAAVWAATRNEVKPFNMGKHKAKFFGKQSVIDDQDYPQEIDVSYTYKGGKGAQKRVYVEAKYDMQTFLDKTGDVQLTPSGSIPKQMYSYQLVRERNKPDTKPTSPSDRRLELFISNSHDWLLLFIRENRNVLKALLDNSWKIVVAGNKINPETAVQVGEKVDRLIDDAFRKSGKRSQKIKGWAREMSKLYPTATSFLIASVSTPVDRETPSPPQSPTTTPLPNPWLLATQPPHVPQAMRVLELAKFRDNRFLSEFRQLVDMLSDLGTLRRIVRALRLVNPDVLRTLRSQANLSDLNENQAWAVATVVRQVEDEFTRNRPRFLE
jgi:hypothetical protein